MKKSPKVAIVCDYLTAMGGAENVILAMHEAFPDAPIYTSIYLPEKVPVFNGLDIRTTWLQGIPKPLRKFYKFFPTLQVKAFQELDLDEFDIILTSSYLNANQVQKTRDDQVLISYCHTPARYYWSHYELYRHNPGYGKLNWIVKPLIPLLVPGQRKKDYQAAQKVDIYIANSSETQARIKKYYGRNSTVIHPPVNTKRFKPSKDKGEHYITFGRQTQNKRFDLAVEACNQLGLKLMIFGNGQEHQRLRQIAGPTIEFRTDRFGDASDSELEKYLSTARGFIFPSDEDFGIVTVESLAAGTPVIGYASGGTLDIIQEGKTGTLFNEQTAKSVVDAIRRFETMKFNPIELTNTAKRYDHNLFLSKLKKIVQDNS